MGTDQTPQTDRYFWSGWFEGHSLALLFMTFILLSLADLAATLRLMLAGIIREGNALANSIWQSNGPFGFIAYKAALVLVVLSAIWFVHTRNPKLARTVLYGGILVMGVVALRHIAIIGVVTARSWGM